MVRKVKEEKKKEIQESAEGTSLAQLQISEQALQNLLLQKQVFQFEFVETNNALEELKKTNQEEVFKIVGSLMIKANKSDLEKELERKKDIINLRLKAIEKQETELKNKLLRHRDALLKQIKE
ncbi:MAG: prefoldin subunit [Candidatus Pacearchaeota archaeon]